MKPTTIASLQKCKQDKKRFATITAYDYSFAKLFADEGLNVMLVGDSLGMTVQGHDSTLPVTVEDIAYHTAAVRRGAPNCLLLADLPFMAYATPEQAFENAATVMRAGANMVKIEGGEWLVETVKMLTERAVPVCGHLGLTPQSVNIFGGYKVQGRGDEAGDQLLSDALALEAAGAQLLVLPAAWVKGPQKEHHWATLLAARALDTTCYIVAAGECGTRNIGLSRIVDPLGTTLAGAGSEPQLIFADLSADDLARVRERLPVLRNRRFAPPQLL